MPGSPKTADELNAEIAALLASGQTPAISAAQLRQVVLDMVASEIGPIAGVTAGPNTVLAGPASGAALAPAAFRDLVAADIPGGTGAGGGGLFNTVAAVLATTVDPSASTIQTAGYYVAGDGGGALYYRAAAAPTNNIFITDGSGAVFIYGEEDYRALAAGCKFDGVTDDTANLRLAIRAAMFNGKTLILPPGTALTGGKIGFNGTTLGITKKFAIVGAGQQLTIIKRGSAWTSNAIMEFDQFPLGFTLEGFAVDVNNRGFQTLQHSLVVYRCSHVRLNGMRATDFTECGFLMYCENTDAPTYLDVISNNCIAEGSTAPHPSGVAGGQSGHELANMYQSGINNALAFNILNPSPGVGMQLKNNCQQCWINGGLTQHAVNGSNIGSDHTAGSTGVIDSALSNIICFDCEVGFIAGVSQRCNVDLPLIDCGNRSAPGRGVQLEECQSISVTVGQIKNFHLAANFTSTATDNDLTIDDLWQDDNTVHIAYNFDALTDRNRLVITRYSKPTGITTLNGANAGGAFNVALLTTGTASPALIPAGTNVVSAQAASGSAVGGNTRGTSSVDLQTSRTLATQVAGGNYSVIIGGQNNSANTSYAIAGGADAISSGILSVAVGASVTASGAYSWAMGNRATTQGIFGKQAWASGRFGADGDAQSGLYVLRNNTASVTPTQLSTDGLVAGTANGVILPDNSCFACYGRVMGREGATGVMSDWEIKATIKRGVGVGTTALVGSSTVTLLNQDGGAAAWALGVTADATNGGLAVTVTQSSGVATHWVARIQTTEMT